MFITHSYVGTAQGMYKCLFFLLLEDYVQGQSEFVQKLDLELERFARNLGHAGALVRPFTGDIETTREHVQDKDWTDAQKSTLTKTPGILVINVDFDDFDPREHNWLHFHFGERKYQEFAGSYEAGILLREIASTVCNSDEDIFPLIRKTLQMERLSDICSIFEVKPGIFGCSIDLIKAFSALQKAFSGIPGR